MTPDQVIQTINNVYAALYGKPTEFAPSLTIDWIRAHKDAAAVADSLAGILFNVGD